MSVALALAGHPGIRAALRGHDPSPEQERAITAPLRPCAVIAGAGSGKTAVMAARLVWLVDQGFAADGLLGLTFTHKASGELHERVRAALDAMGVVEEPTVLTYHGFADLLVSAAATRLGLRGGRLMSEAQRWQILMRAAERVGFEDLEVRSPEVLGDALVLASRLADHLVDPRDLIAFDDGFLSKPRSRGLAKPVRRAALERRELARLVTAFGEEKRARGLVDFDDQIALAVELADDPEVAAEMRARWSAVLLDEYQDTNVAQVALVRRLWSATDFPLTAVGDPQQAIYGFRGATLDNIASFDLHFGAAGPLQLSTSFRCDRLVLDAANTVAARLPPEQQGATLRPRPDAGPGAVELFWATDHVAEAEEIARRADSLRSLYDVGQMAVLVRSRRPLFPAVRTALEERGIPVEVLGLGGLLDVPEVVEVTSTLRSVHDPSADRHLARWLLGPQLRVSPGDLSVLARWAAAHGGHLLDGVRAAAVGRVDDVSREAAARCGELASAYDRLRGFLRRPLPELVERVVEIRGIGVEIDSWPLTRGVTAQRHLDSFLDHVARFAPVDGTTSVAAFLAYLAAVARQPDEMETLLPPSEDAVTLLTIHQAKGLEFDVVFLPMLATGRMPADWAASSWVDKRSLLPSPLRQDARFLPDFESVREVYAAFERQVKVACEEEERRVFYVALTRARHHVVASGAWYYGEGLRPSQPSPFYVELAAVPGVEEAEPSECPDESPVVRRALAAAAGWPGPGRTEFVDELFPEGLSRALPEAESRLARLTPEERAGAEAELHRLGSLHPAVPAPIEPGPDVVSVTSLESLARCPRRFYWERVRPLPRPRHRAMAVGDVVHGEIERRVLGLPPDQPAEPHPRSLGAAAAPSPPRVGEVLAAFESSRFGGRPAVHLEAPFSLARGRRAVRGRIDAIYEREGRWEIVDWKTGARLDASDPAANLQMDLYGLAAVEAFARPIGAVDLTLVYLALGEEHTRPFDAPAAEAAGARLDALLGRLDQGGWDATPGPHCRGCDFAAVCPWAAP